MADLGGIDPKRLIRALCKAGWIVERDGARHVVLGKAGQKNKVSVPRHTGDLGKGLVRSILRAAGMTPDEFRRLL